MTPPPSAFAHRRAVLAHIIDRNALRYVATLEDLIILSRHGESAVQSFIEGRFRQLGGQVETFQYDPRTIAVPYEFVAPSLVASDRLTAVVSTWPGDGGAGKSLLIFAHPDSEPLCGPTRWNSPPFEPKRQGTRLFGWGIADDLAGLAVMLCVLDAVHASPFRRLGRLVLATAPSKHHARGIVPVLDRIAPVDAGLYLHPPESGAGLAQIKTGTLGTLHCRVHLSGRPPVTAEPNQIPFSEDGINAAHLALDLAQALRVSATEGAPSGIVVCITYLRAGTRDRLHRIPTTAELGVAAVFPATVSPEEAQNLLATSCGRAQETWSPAAAATVECLSITAGAQLAPEDAFVRLVAREIAAIVGYPPTAYDRHPASDIRHPILGGGIPTVGLGPRAGNLTQAHAIDEWVDLDEYLSTIKVVASVLVEWCGAPEEAPAPARPRTATPRRRDN